LLMICAPCRDGKFFIETNLSSYPLPMIFGHDYDVA
jgi:hypothetical protein